MTSAILFVILFFVCIIRDAGRFARGQYSSIEIIEAIYDRYFRINGHDYMGQFMFVYTRLLFLVIINSPIPILYTVLYNFIV